MPIDHVIPSTSDISPARLERPAEGQKLAGVCAAIARHQRVDVRLVRAAAVVLALLGGVGIIAYFAGLILIPAEGHAEPIVREGLDGPERKKVIILGALATIALLDLPEDPFDLFSVSGRATVAILAVAAVAVLVLRRDGASAGPGVVTVADRPAGDDTTLVMPAAGGPGAPFGDDPEIDPPARRRGRSAMILGGVLLAFAAVGSVLGALDGDVRWDVALCASVIAVGGVLAIAAPFGGARILIPFGVILAVAAGGAAAADLNLRGGVGDRLEHPAALASGETDYHLAAGRLMVDLRDADLAPGVTDVVAEVGFGQLVVRAPAGVRVELDTHVSAGEIDLFGRDSDGTDVKRSVILPGPAGAPVLRVDAHVAFGELRVVRAGQALPKLGDDGHVRGLPEDRR
ncbi:MAG: phage shock protein PspC [Solirubrobacterales bacterium]|nr:phage shock protein PspC [Solirubrobacterales bacterium]